jgi:hypothetical protein
MILVGMLAVLFGTTSSVLWAQTPSDATNRAIRDAVQETRDQVQRELERREEQLRKNEDTKEQIPEGEPRQNQQPTERPDNGSLRN